MKKLLVIESYKGIRQTMQAYFEKVPGLVVSSAADGSEALGLCRQGKDYDILLTACDMPGLSGIELIPQVKVLLPNIKTILMSYDQYDGTEKKQIGADRFVDKNKLSLDVLKVMIKDL